MRILLLSENVFGHRDANGNCVWNLAAEMARRGHEVHLLSAAKTREQMRQNEAGGIRLHWLYMPWNYLLAESKNSLHKASLILSKACYKLYLSRRRADTQVQHHLLPLWRSAIRRAVREQKFDALIVCFYPIESVLICSQLAASEAAMPPYWVYQVDAYVTYPLYPAQYKAAREAFVQTAFGSAAGVFTTPLLTEPLQRLLPQAESIIPLEFPLMVQPQIAADTVPPFDAQEISCVFAGALYKGLRDPDFLLKLFAASRVPGVRLHLFLTNKLSEEQKAEWSAGLEDKLVFHPRQPLPQMLAVLRKARFLVNLGNAVPNMLPSKLWDYISSGRPILNICQIENCPTRPHLNKYPAALTLCTDWPIQEAAAMMDDFLLRHQKDETVPFEQIQALYPEATPQTVADTMLKTVTGYLDRTEKEKK